MLQQRLTGGKARQLLVIRCSGLERPSLPLSTAATLVIVTEIMQLFMCGRESTESTLRTNGKLLGKPKSRCAYCRHSAKIKRATSNIQVTTPTHVLSSSSGHEPAQNQRFWPPRSIGRQLRDGPHAFGTVYLICRACRSRMPHFDFREVGTAERYAARLADFCKLTALPSRRSANE